MWGRRIIYLAVLVCCGVFYVVYEGWLSAIVLTVVLGLPWLSLLLSLPAITLFRMTIDAPAALGQGQEGDAWLVGSSFFPLPPFRGQLFCRHCISGNQQPLSDGSLPTDHCGGLELGVKGPRVLDYLGLFSFPVRQKEPSLLRVLPNALPIGDLPEKTPRLPRRWQPKAGGGFSENHELRLYRPGDSLNQVHWKLTAKTGKLTIREPLIPQRGRNLVTMDLGGTPEELDRKLGRLLWLGRWMGDIPFALQVLTGLGLQSFSIETRQDLDRAMDALLCTPACKEGSVLDLGFCAFWQYHIGGEPDEV